MAGQKRPRLGADGEASSSKSGTTTEDVSTAHRLGPLKSSLPFILVTGGSGYIGSHTVLTILETGHYSIVIIDSLENSKEESVRRLTQLAKEQAEHLEESARPSLWFFQTDLRRIEQIERVVEQFSAGSRLGHITHLIHFAALKSLPESVKIPLDYYTTNVVGTINLLRICDLYNIRNVVFSSSAVVYGRGAAGEGIGEEGCVLGGLQTAHSGEDLADIQQTLRRGISNGSSPRKRLRPRQREPSAKSWYVGGEGITNPYGRTKWMCEEILRDLCVSDPRWRVIILRYFNPTGAHPSGMIGEDPKGTPTNLMPYVCQVIQGRQGMNAVHVYGDDYETRDGTGIRDYVHVCDLAEGHVKALEVLESFKDQSDETPGHPNIKVFNLGTGHGYSVFEILDAMTQAASRPNSPVREQFSDDSSRANAHSDPTAVPDILAEPRLPIPRTIAPRRRGDIAIVTADPTRAEREMGWRAHRGLNEMCQDLWRWVKQNPQGFSSSTP